MSIANYASTCYHVLMIEEWLPVPYKPFDERYAVSNYGRVKPIVKSKFSHMKGEFLKPGVGARGYSWVALYYEGKMKQAFIHRMVAISFIGQPSIDKPLVCHIDDNKLNNKVSNLVWGDSKYNMKLMIEHGRSMYGERNTKAKLNNRIVTEIRTLYKNKNISQQKLADIYGVNQTQISRIVLNQHWTKA